MLNGSIFFIIIYHNQDKFVRDAEAWIQILISLRLKLVKGFGFNPPFKSYVSCQDKSLEKLKEEFNLTEIKNWIDLD